MTSIINQTASNEIGRLTQVLFVFHSWLNLSILGPDGTLFGLDTKMLDVDRASFKDGQVGGIGYLQRLRLLPISTTQRPLINNSAGFAVTNVYTGPVSSDGQPKGIGVGLGSSMKTNVKAEWTYPDTKVQDMIYTFGKYGLVGVHSMVATSDPKSMRRCQDIARLILSGFDERATPLEDLPEYFDPTFISPYLHDKRRARFARTAEDIIEEASSKDGIAFDGSRFHLSEVERGSALLLAEEMLASAVQAHIAALDTEANGILPSTREQMQSKTKRAYDKCDQWLMSQFPSFPMDTELEKSNKQILRALDGGTQQPAEPFVPEGFVPVEQFNEMQERMTRLEAAMTASAGAGASAKPRKEVAAAANQPDGQE
jgi:hypothetical protein